MRVLYNIGVRRLYIQLEGRKFPEEVNHLCVYFDIHMYVYIKTAGGSKMAQMV